MTLLKNKIISWILSLKIPFSTQLKRSFSQSLPPCESRFGFSVTLIRAKCSLIGDLVNCEVKLAKQEAGRQNTEVAGHVASHFLSPRCTRPAFLPLSPYVRSRPRRRKRPVFSTWHHSDVAHTGANAAFPSPLTCCHRLVHYLGFLSQR